MAHFQRYALLIGGDLPTRERAVLCTARALNLPVVILAYPGEQLAQRRRIAAGLADDFIVAPASLDPQHALEAVRAYQERTGAVPAAVVPVNDFVLEAGAAIARHYSLPFLSNKVILNCRDKLVMKQAFSAAGLNVAETLAVDAQVSDFRFAPGQRVIFKPSVFGGSGGVCLVRDQEELHQAMADAKQLLERYGDALYFDPTRIHLEAFLDSDQEVSVEVFCTSRGCNAVAVTQKQLSARPHFAEMGHLVPYAGSDDAVLRNTAEQACQALGLDMGVAHVEIKVVDGKPYLIEIGARPAGDKIIDLVYRALGVDLYALHARSYQGFQDEFPTAVPAGTAAVTFLKSPAGIIRKVNCPELPEGVRELTLYKGVGEHTATQARNFETREGHVEWFWPAERGNAPDFMAQTSQLCNRLFDIEPA
ncbi:ATP-grasp domain-containing protein [Pseudomonas sp. M5]|uniref:ATP-grasp domain-containing protein n=1 Tax=Pseudomonas sp. M5 TaxID=1620788 RepID=UPI0018CAE5EB|nr:ATP-grasp domain-containing protein [Pseudomonas sp. M5]MBM7395522.1 biotin carboxylase [Pseudomonas sp. M5]QPN47425.1 ATP-grasp domain-containing protein [Priestia aryabhattai]HDS1758847.1 ATP-grasp domain-containing protein [Pseudomonas putida]